MIAVAGDVGIDGLLIELGFVDADAKVHARRAIEEAGLTNRTKGRIALTKRHAVEAVLRSRFAIICSRDSCVAADSSGRVRVSASRPSHCEVCQGLPNASAIARALAKATAMGWRRLVVVGGSPGVHVELERLVADWCELRLVSGTDRRTSRDAKADLLWADLVIIWGSTELDHQVSRLYTDGAHRRVVTCPRRSISALAETISVAVTKRSR